MFSLLKLPSVPATGRWRERGRMGRHRDRMGSGRDVGLALDI
jgi:hypothetical protein